MKLSQSDRVINWLATGRSLTPLQALSRWGVMRLSARVKDLRKDGHDIQTDRVTKRGKTYASYRLAN